MEGDIFVIHLQLAPSSYHCPKHLSGSTLSFPPSGMALSYYRMGNPASGDSSATIASPAPTGRHPMKTLNSSPYPIFLIAILTFLVSSSSLLEIFHGLSGSKILPRFSAVTFSTSSSLLCTFKIKPSSLCSHLNVFSEQFSPPLTPGHKVTPHLVWLPSIVSIVSPPTNNYHNSCIAPYSFKPPYNTPIQYPWDTPYL